MAKRKEDRFYKSSIKNNIPELWLKELSEGDYDDLKTVSMDFKIKHQDKFPIYKEYLDLVEKHKPISEGKGKRITYTEEQINNINSILKADELEKFVVTSNVRYKKDDKITEKAKKFVVTSKSISFSAHLLSDVKKTPCKISATKILKVEKL